jgi:histidine triad (HIT) family protein
MSLSHHSDDNCLFCKIIAGKIPSQKIWSDENCYAFLDISPVNHGHFLVVPRQHHRDLTELSAEDAGKVATVIPLLAKALVRSTGADGFNLIVNNGAVAGQTVFHGHWHLIPRFKDDPVNWPWPHGRYEGDEMNQVAFAIEREIALLQGHSKAE